MVTEINSWTDLKNIVNDYTGSYILMKDLSSTDADYVGIGDSWVPIGNATVVGFPRMYPYAFTGSFDGNGFTISDLKINVTNPYSGLFGYCLNGCTFTNINVINILLNSNSGFCGGIAGYTANGQFTNCTCSGTINGLAYIGGIVGGGYMTMNNCSSNVNINGSTGSNFGGIVGVIINNSTINNCHSNVNIIADNRVGGFVGRTQGRLTVTNCYSEGEIYCNISSPSIVGGFVGISESNLGDLYTDCYSSCNITANSSTGGFVGKVTSGTFTNCYSTGTLTAINNGRSNYGGFAGHVSSSTVSMSKCFSTSNLYSSGLEFTLRIGGFCGYLESPNATISDCYARGNIYGNTNPYGSSNIGGFIGVYYKGNINRCYSTGHVDGYSYIYGFANAPISGIITNCFYDTNTSGKSDTSTATPLTTANMKIQSNFTNWNFLTIWGISSLLNNNYPFLLWQSTNKGRLKIKNLIKKLSFKQKDSKTKIVWQ